MGKIKNVLGLSADLAPGVLAVLSGLTLIVGAKTGMLW